MVLFQTYLEIIDEADLLITATRNHLRIHPEQSYCLSSIGLSSLPLLPKMSVVASPLGIGNFWFQWIILDNMEFRGLVHYVWNKRHYVEHLNWQLMCTSLEVVVQHDFGIIGMVSSLWNTYGTQYTHKERPSSKMSFFGWERQFSIDGQTTEYDKL